MAARVSSSALEGVPFDHFWQVLQDLQIYFILLPIVYSGRDSRQKMDVVKQYQWGGKEPLGGKGVEVLAIFHSPPPTFLKNFLECFRLYCG